MIALTGVAIHSKIYESLASLVCRVIKVQEYEITRSLNLKSPHVLEGTLPLYELTCAKCHEGI